MGDILKLLSFIEFLKSEAGFMFDVDRFEHRLMLQKYVYIAGRVFRLPLNYSYNMYLRGPYSPDLAEDYYKLPESHEAYTGDYRKDLTGFNCEKFLDLIEEKDAEWLEVGATILSVYNRYRGRYFGYELAGRVLSTSCDIKSSIESAKISDVFEYLKNERLLIV